MNNYNIPQGAFYSEGKKFAHLLPGIIGFEFSFQLTRSAFYKAKSTDLQKIGGVTLDPLKQSIIRLAYRTMDHRKMPLPDGMAELHAYLSLGGKYVVASRKLGIIQENFTYTGKALFNKEKLTADFLVNGIGAGVNKSYPFKAKPFSTFGIGGYYQYPYFEDRGMPAPQDLEYWLEITPVYGSSVNSSGENMRNLAGASLKTPLQLYEQAKHSLLRGYRRLTLPVDYAQMPEF